MSETREIIGFLGRWLLLAVGAAVVAAAGWLAVDSAVAARRLQESALIFGDDISLPASGLYAVAVTDPPEGGLRAVFWRRNGGPVQVGGSQWRAMYLPLGDTFVPQDLSVQIVGCPYGADWRLRDRSILRIYPPGRNLVLLDAALLETATPESYRSEIVPALAELRREGSVVWLSNRPVEELGPIRLGLGEQLTDPLLAGRRDRGLPSSIESIRYRLRLRPGQMTIVTADATVAQWCEKNKYPARLVSDAGQLAGESYP